MMKVTLSAMVPRDAIPPELLAPGLPDRVANVCSAAAAVLYRAHFRARNAEKAGNWGAPSNYWAAASEAVEAGKSVDGYASISIKHPGILWHLMGGIIEAKPGKALSLPFRPENKGIWPSEKFPNEGDAFVYSDKSHGRADGVKGRAFLARNVRGKLQLEYLLLKSVTKRADPTVVPEDKAVAETCGEAAEQVVERVIVQSRINGGGL